MFKSLTFKIDKEFLIDEEILIGKCTQYNIVVQARNKHSLNDRIYKTLIGHIAIARKLGLIPFECLIHS